MRFRATVSIVGKDSRAAVAIMENVRRRPPVRRKRKSVRR